MTDPIGWFVVRIRPNQVRRAIDNMENQGCEVYVPRGMVRGRNRRLSVQPLFPGYAFARHPERRWAFLRGTRGVLGVVLSAGTDERDPEPAVLPHAEIARLRAREGPDGLVRLQAREFAPGERVRVEKGAVSLDAVVDGMSGQDRVFVLMAVMGRQTRVEVAVADLTK